MALTRQAIFIASATALLAVAAGAIAYRTWRVVDRPQQVSSSSQTALKSAPARSAAPPSGQGAPSPAASLAETGAAPIGAPPAKPVAAAMKAEAPEPPSSAAPALEAPSFDVVRVEPSGDAVIAGRATPEAKVALLDNGSAVGKAVEATADGQFVDIPPKLAKGAHELSLVMTVKGQTVKSKQTVTVVVPDTADGRLVVALAAPGQPTKVLADSSTRKPAPTETKTVAAKDNAQVHIETVEVGSNGGFFASGTAPSNGPLRLYLNNAPVATAKADQGGHWSLQVKKGLKAGDYVVRADALNPQTGAVLARAEAHFQFKGLAAAASTSTPATAAVTASAPAEAPAAAPQPGGEKSTANAIVADLPTVKVVRGDSLWAISRRIFGRGIRYTIIYDANANQIRNRNLIYPGQIFVVPRE